MELFPVPEPIVFPFAFTQPAGTYNPKKRLETLVGGEVEKLIFCTVLFKIFVAEIMPSLMYIVYHVYNPVPTVLVNVIGVPPHCGVVPPK